MKLSRKNNKIEDLNLELKSLSSHASSLIQGNGKEISEFWGGFFDQPD